MIRPPIRTVRMGGRIIRTAIRTVRIAVRVVRSAIRIVRTGIRIIRTAGRTVRIAVRVAAPNAKNRATFVARFSLYVAEKTRTSTPLRAPAPQAGASAISPPRQILLNPPRRTRAASSSTPHRPESWRPNTNRCHPQAHTKANRFWRPASSSPPRGRKRTKSRYPTISTIGLSILSAPTGISIEPLMRPPCAPKPITPLCSFLSV